MATVLGTSSEESLTKALQVVDGGNHLSPGADPSSARVAAPAAAPASAENTAKFG